MDVEFMMLLIFGHLFGDYLFQNDWMALNKKEKVFPCVIHCLVYSIIIFILICSDLILYNFPIDLLIASFVFIFMSHYIIDRSNFIEWWFNLIRGRSFKRVLHGWYIEGPKYQFRITFTALVQTVADNTLHLFLMFLWFRFWIDKLISC